MEILVHIHRYDKVGYKTANPQVNQTTRCPKCDFPLWPDSYPESIRKHKRGISCKSRCERKAMIEAGYTAVYTKTDLHSRLTSLLKQMGRPGLMSVGKYGIHYIPSLLLCFFRALEDNETGLFSYNERYKHIVDQVNWFVSLSQEEQLAHIDGLELAYECYKDQLHANDSIPF